MSQYSRLSPSFVTKQLQTQRQNLAAVCRLIMLVKYLRGIFQFYWNWKPVRINHAPAGVWTMHRPYWPQCDIARSPSCHLYWTKTKTPAVTYSKHMVLVIWIIVAHFHLCSLLGTLSRYTVLEVWAVRRPMRVCCGIRLERYVLFANILDSLTALAWCIIWPCIQYTAGGSAKDIRRRERDSLTALEAGDVV